MCQPINGVREKLALLMVPLVMGVAALDVRAETPSAPAGFYRLDCLGNSDTIVSIPFSRPATNSSPVQSIAGDVVTVSGTPGWLVNQFVYVSGTQPNTYYLRFLSGAKEGSYYPIVANGANSLTLSLGGEDISSVTNGTRLSVIPYWTLATAFPEGKGVHRSSVFTRRTQILIPDYVTSGVNLAPMANYYFLTNATFPNGIWQQVNHGTTNKNDDILLPDLFFTVRHMIAEPTVFTARGSVPVSNLATPLVANASGKQDNFVALARPAVVTLNQSALFESGAFLASSVFTRRDELLAYDNTETNRNKVPAAIYYYRGDLSRWLRVNDAKGFYGTNDMGSQAVFVPGSGFIIRKSAVTPGGALTPWINPPNY